MVSYTRKIRSKSDGLLKEQSSENKNLKASLFERLAVDSDGSDLTLRGGVPGHIDSIKRNINRILNTNFGSSASSNKMGLKDVNDLSQNQVDLLKLIAEDIKRNISDHEPRVSNVIANAVEDDVDVLRLTFNVQAEIYVNNKQEKIIIDIVLENGSHYLVQ